MRPGPRDEDPRARHPIMLGGAGLSVALLLLALLGHALSRLEDGRPDGPDSRSASR